MASSETTLWRLKDDDEWFGMAKGDVLECKPYWLDPSAKLEVVRRVSDGFDPQCTVYRYQVEPVRDGEPVAAVGEEDH